MNKRARIVLVSTVLLALLVSSPASAVDVCRQSFLMINGATDTVVDIDCETGYTLAANATVNLLAGAHISEVYGGPGGGILTSGGYNTINIYAGQIDTMLNFGSTDAVTVYGSDFAVNGVLLDPAQTQITSPSSFLLTGLYQDGTPLSLPCVLDSGAVLNLDIPQTAPEIYVQPALLSWDFGDVEVGQSTTVMVQIFNYGTADLNVSSVTLTGDASFAITSGPAASSEKPLVIAPNTSVGVDFEVTFAPTAEGLPTATVEIVSDDEDESEVFVDLSAAGIVTEVPPLQQIQDILDFFDASVAQGTLQGYGPGNNAANRLKALRNMIESASDLIEAGAYDQAAAQLASIAEKTDGVSKPQDFAVGEAVTELNAMVEALIVELMS